MFKNYIDSLLDKVIYYKDEDGVIIAKIPDKPGYFTQGENFEEARENMIDLIEAKDDLQLKHELNNDKKFKSLNKKLDKILGNL